jgi:hypothetical protein
LLEQDNIELSKLEDERQAAVAQAAAQRSAPKGATSKLVRAKGGDDSYFDMLLRKQASDSLTVRVLHFPLNSLSRTSKQSLA